MPRYILKSNGPGTDAWTIRHARRIVGSVRKHPTSASYVGRIGQHTFEGHSAEMAFREVAARAMGFDSAAALRSHNAGVRANNRAQRANIRSRLAGDAEPEMFEVIPDNL